MCEGKEGKAEVCEVKEGKAEVCEGKEGTADRRSASSVPTG